MVSKVPVAHRESSLSTRKFSCCPACPEFPSKQGMVAHPLPHAPSSQPPSALTGMVFVLPQSHLPSPQGREKTEKGRRGPALQGNAQAGCGLAQGGRLWPAAGSGLPSCPRQWWFGRLSSKGQGSGDLCLHCPGLRRLSWRVLGSPRPAAVCLDLQPVSRRSSPGSRGLVTFTLHLKCRPCGLATGNSLCHTQCVSQSAFLLSLLSGSFKIFLGKLGQRFLPVDLNLNFLKKLPVVPCQQWTLPWGEARVSPSAKSLGLAPVWAARVPCGHPQVSTTPADIVGRRETTRTHWGVFLGGGSP